MNQHQPHPAATDMNGDGDPNANSTLFVGIVGFLVIVLPFIGLQAYFRTFAENENDPKIFSRPVTERETLAREQLERISGYRWVGEAGGVVAIPIDRAIEMVAGRIK